jgi:hypothetical protein
MNQRWLCPRCRTLLGIFREDSLELRYKEVIYRVRRPAEVEALCRRCGERVKSS